jgi:hypothetical protein
VQYAYAGLIYTFFKKSGIITEFNSQKFHDIATAALGGYTIVTMFGNLNTGPGRNETGQSGDVKGILAVAARTT